MTGTSQRYRNVADQFAARVRAVPADGPRVEVAPDADEQARLLAFTGRRP